MAWLPSCSVCSVSLSLSGEPVSVNERYGLVGYGEGP
jgi:hypothetical protein